MSRQNMITVGLYGIEKRLRRHKCSNRWLRRELINTILYKHKPEEWLPVLQDVTFEVSNGESVGIIGPNGTGKSTLLKLVAGIMKPTSGKIVRKGTVCTLLDVGAGFQEDLTGRENAFMNGAILGLPEDYLRKVLPEIASFAELEDFMDTPIRYYSSGMKARLGFSVAMNARPDIFLIDEVLAVGDEGFRKKCYARLERMVTAGMTAIIVSHDLYALRRLCTRGIWLTDGCVKADGPIDEVTSEYEACFH